MKLLAIDAAGSSASVALWIDGALRERSAGSERGHGEQLLGYVDALLAESGLALGQLDAIAFGRGPGAFTGLRLAASITQGLAFAAGLPVLPISNLEAVAWQAAAAVDPAGAAGVAGQGILACQDARMGEAYWAAYLWQGAVLLPQLPESVSPPERVVVASAGWRLAQGGIPGAPAVRAAGTALQAYPGLAARLAEAGTLCQPPMPPPAAALAALAARLGPGAAVSAEQAVPTYIRDDVARPPG
jgi:tRNA threonylcarbamoyladenosine biosynthesis protein TsaB